MQGEFVLDEDLLDRFKMLDPIVQRALIAASASVCEMQKGLGWGRVSITFQDHKAKMIEISSTVKI